MSVSLNQLGYLPFVLLTVVGVYLMLSHRNFLRALVGLQVLQTGVILFFVLMAVREGATVPILPEAPRSAERHAAGDHAETEPHAEAEAPSRGEAVVDDHEKSHVKYDVDAPIENPIPQALMLTAIVVGVATQGVGLAILREIRRETGSIEDPKQREGGD